jgi:hypothetical protein
MATKKAGDTKSSTGPVEADAPFENGVANSFWLTDEAFPTEKKRTIIMTGVARSGTSFVGSVFGNLGVPMARSEDDAVSGHWENLELRRALVERRYADLERIIGEFDSQYDTWAWKAPAIRNDFEAILKYVRNPCFVFVFKEPLSVAMRKIERNHQADFVKHFRRMFQAYSGLVEFAQETDRPCMLVSFDRAVKNTETTVKNFARFAGVTDYDVASVVEKIRTDGQNYVGSAKAKSS